MRGTEVANWALMSSESQTKSFWNTVFGRRKDSGATPDSSATRPPSAESAEQPVAIEMPAEQRKLLEDAIPFHRPPEQTGAVDGPQFIFGPLDPKDEPRGAQPKERPPEVESFRKKYKKYGRDVCLPGEAGEPYDVLMDNSDKSHHGVNSVSPL